MQAKTTSPENTARQLHSTLDDFVRAHGQKSCAWGGETYAMTIGTHFRAEVTDTDYGILQTIVRVLRIPSGSVILDSRLRNNGEYSVLSMDPGEFPALKRAIQHEQQRASAHNAIRRFYQP